MGSYSTPPDFPARQAEILPPATDDNFAQEAELRAVRERGSGRRSGARSWAHAPATYILVGINCLVFLGMVFSGVSIMNPTTQQLMHSGANNPVHVLIYGEWWRIITAMFVHVGIIHLATNMWCLWNLGLLAEPLLGPAGVFAAYILSGAAGNLLSIGYDSFFKSGTLVGAGASGAVFGIAGVLIILLKSKRLPIPPKELAGLRRYVIYFALINFVLGFGSMAVRTAVQIDNMAHLGGFLGGILFALPLVPLIGSPRPLFRFRLRLAIGLLCSVLVFFSFYISTAVAVTKDTPTEQQ
ncbi:rhomboid family intramembrane serine protease [Acidicapsa ligni]|uniref:rhomboid family intramembrane serine protease n=1 Tax=Acidicapsa ligni TaxID=542300 RepID=UPI0021E0B2FA|nr:rhomboid family intramembrane serine protease [Acidicapsa ligni]